MKSIKFLPAFALAATLFVQTLSANTIENVYTMDGTTVKIAANAKNIIVNLGDVQKEEITIALMDDDQNTLMSETIKDVKNFAKKYNVSRLEDGDYRMIVTKKTIRTVQPFSILHGEVTMSVEDKKDKFLPTLSFQNDNLDVNVLLSNYSNIIVKLYDNEGREVMNDKQMAEFKLNKRYNLTNLQSGVYVAEVTAGDEIFRYTIAKE
jgi:Secretion system C-terminal sorting domain